MNIRLELRRLTAALLLFSPSAWSLEAGLGMSREGNVHHESLATAMDHQSGASGEHGHEDGGPVDHGPKHRHGTAADHCTHVHGIGLASVCPDIEAPVLAIPPRAASSPRIERATTPDVPPPRIAT